MDGGQGLSEFLRYHRRMLVLMVVVSLVVAGALAFFLPGDLGWAGGFALGAAAQLLKFGFIDVGVVRRVAAGDPGAPAAQVKSLFLSLALFGLAAAAVVKLRWSVWALAAGIFLPRLILLADAYLRPNPFGRSDRTQAAGAREGDTIPKDDEC